MQAFAELIFAGPGAVPNQVNALRNIIEMAPSSCKIILVWLPFRDDAREFVAQSSAMSESRDEFKRLLDDMSHPRLELHWFERPEDIAMPTEDYLSDGAHFLPAGLDRVTDLYAELIKPHLLPSNNDTR